MKSIQISLIIMFSLFAISCKNEKKTISQAENLKETNVVIKQEEITEESFEANAVINFEYTEKIIVKDLNGNELGFLQNNQETEDYVSLTIKKDSLQLFYVKAVAEITGTNIEGWIKKANYIGTYARNYEEGQVLNLYEEPNKKSKIKSIVKEWIPDLYIITKFRNNWVFVNVVYEEKKYSGWLEPEMQCPNSYSTCN